MEDTVISERYEVLSTLGKGGMGVVLKCHDTILQRVVAVKVLGTTTSGNAIKRFQREARAAAKLKQANILQVHDFGETADGRLYLVMDFVEGMTLEQLLKERKYLPIEEAIPLFQQLCKGIAHAHGQGVFHRDIKPSNIMLADTESDWVKIVDFGIAKLNSDDQKLTSTNAIIGSPPYMAPEATMKEEVDVRADIYSIGCLMFETLTGSPPYDGETAMAIVLMHTSEPIPRLSERSDQSLPPEMEKIVTTCLAKNPGDRYQSVDELSAALDSLEKMLLDQAEKEAEQREQEEKKEKEASSSRNVKPAKSKEAPIVAFTAISLVVIVVGVFASFVTTKPDSTSESTYGKKKRKLKQIKREENELMSFNPKSKASDKYEEDLIKDSVKMKDRLKIFNRDGSAKAGSKTNDDQVIKQFDEFKDFKRWCFSDSQIGLVAIKKIATSKVEYLEVKNTLIDDSSMEVIGDIENLKMLQVGGCVKITPSGYRALRHNKKLHMLQLSLPKDAQSATEVIDILGTLKGLTDLDIHGTMNGAMIEKVASFKRLVTLEMDTPATDGWNEIRKLRHLQSIKLFINGTDAAAFRHAHLLHAIMPQLEPKTAKPGPASISDNADQVLKENDDVAKWMHAD